LLVALVLPSILNAAKKIDPETGLDNELGNKLLKLSRGTAVILLVAYGIYVWFQIRSHHGLYDEILQADSAKDTDRHKDLYKAKLTMTESLVAIVIAVTSVSFMAIFLVDEIEYLVDERGLKDA
jgi:Ca2+:H+ antiporter